MRQFNPDMVRAAEDLSKRFVSDNGSYYIEDHFLHVCEILQSCLETKYGFGREGGSAVRAIVNNDLMRAFECADSIVGSSMRTILSGLQTIRLQDIEKLAATYTNKSENP